MNASQSVDFAPASSITIAGIRFFIDGDGIVSTKDGGVLGHFEYCQHQGLLWADLLTALQE